MKRQNQFWRKLSVWSLMGVLGCAPATALAQTEMKVAQRNKAKKAAPVVAKSLTEAQRAGHLLERITFGARPGEVGRVQKLGWQKYLAAQLQPEALDDALAEQKLKQIATQQQDNAALAKAYYPDQQVIAAALKTRGYDIAELNGGVNAALAGNANSAANNAAPNSANGEMKTGDSNQARQGKEDQFKRRREIQRVLQEMGYRQPQELVTETQQAKLIRAVYSERQLQEVMTDFWFNHFNVYIQKGADRVLTTAYERDVIRPRVFGKFEALLKATAESPAMLWYLDNWISTTPNAQPRFAGRFAQANPNNPQQQARRMMRGINENYAREIMELHTLGVDGGYTQKDVQEVARCFTGWTLRNPRGGAQFFFNPQMHDDGEKIVLGQKIAAGGGINDGYQVISLLAKHPSTARFISTKLARKFVQDNPPAALVEKMAQRYLKTDGDLREVLLTLFHSNEFWAAENYRAKIKTPFEMTVSAARALNAETNGGPGFHRWIAQMGEGLFLAQPPTGYPDMAERWVNTGALLDRMNFSLALSANRIPGTRVALAKLAPATTTAISDAQLIDHFAGLLLRGELSPQSRATIEQSLQNTHAPNNSMPGNPATAAPHMDEAKVAKVVGLLLGSPEFQRQ